MKRGRGLAAAVALLLCGCGPVADSRSNQIAELSLPEDYDPLAPLTVELAAQGGTCRATVQGQAVDGEQLLQRALGVLMHSVEVQEAAAGRVDDLPPAILRTGPELPWRCAAGAIYLVQRAGFVRILFDRPRATPIAVNVPQINHHIAVSETDGDDKLTISVDASLRLNGAAITPDQLSEYLRTTARQAVPPPLVILPDAQVRVEAVLALLARLRDAGIELATDDPVGDPARIRFEGADLHEVLMGLELYRNELK